MLPKTALNVKCTTQCTPFSAPCVERRTSTPLTRSGSAMPSSNVCIISQNPDSTYIQNLTNGLRTRDLTPTIQSFEQALAAPAGQPVPGIVDLRQLDDASFYASLDLLQRSGTLWIALTDVDAKRLNPARRRLVFERAWASIEPSDDLELVCELVLLARRHMVLSGRAGAHSTASFGEMVGGSPVMLKLYDKLKRKPFVALNCAAIPAERIGSELFGHELGDFTDGSTTRIGRLEQAQGGTLFLDEIGDLPLEAQTYLLHALQEGVIERLGSTEPIARHCGSGGDRRKNDRALSRFGTCVRRTGSRQPRERQSALSAALTNTRPMPGHALAPVLTCASSELTCG